MVYPPVYLEDLCRVSTAIITHTWDSRYHVLIFLRLLLRGCAGSSSGGKSYGDGRAGILLRALPGVRCTFVGTKDSGCEARGVEVFGSVCDCGGCSGSGGFVGAGASGKPSDGPPNENPKFTSFTLRVLFWRLAATALLWFRGV